jgi:antitoxin PrlF
MIKAKITSKGQITIPKEVREKLSAETGDYVVFDISGEAVKLVPFKSKQLSDLYATLPATRPYPGHQTIRIETAAKVAESILGKENKS